MKADEKLKESIISTYSARIDRLKIIKYELSRWLKYSEKEENDYMKLFIKIDKIISSYNNIINDKEV